MNEIKTFHVNNLPNDNHLPYNMNVRDYAQQDEAVRTKFADILTPYAAAIQAEDNAMHKNPANPLTPEIEQTDKDRDTTYYIIEHMVDVYLHYPDGQEKTDAETIDRYLKVNKVNPQAQYDRETGQIINLVQDLEANCETELERLGLTQHLANLKQLNLRMYDLLKERDEDYAKNVLNAVRTARRRTDDLYHRLVWAVNAFAFVSPGTYDTFINNVNQTIDRLNLNVFKITSSSKPGTGSEVETPETPEGSEDSESSELDPAENITIKFRGTDNKILHEVVVPVDYQMPESEYPTPPEGTHWNFTLADLNLAIGMKNPGDTITVRAQAD